MSASLKITGTESMKKRLRELSARAANPEPALRQIANVLADHVDDTFDTQGTSTGQPWKPLSAPYAARKTFKSTRAPLVLTGALKDSFRPGQAWHIERLSTKSLIWGTRHSLARLHQKGSPGKQVPARPMLVITPELKRKVRDEFKAHILGN